MLLRFLYTLVLYLILPFALIRLGGRGFRNKAYWNRWTERLGLIPWQISGQQRFWVHAVSVGEVKTATPMIHHVQAAYPHLEILVTTVTPTGAECVRQEFGRRAIHCYLPYDLPGPVRRFLRRSNPCIVVLIETELWPNLLHECHRLGMPVVLANARLSERSWIGYRRFASLTRDMLGKVTTVAAQTCKDADRLIALGMDPRSVTVTGNMKFDVSTPAVVVGKARSLRHRLGVHRPIWIAASTHRGEEASLLDAHERILRRHPGCLLQIAPRHPERFDHVADLCRIRGFQICRRSETLAIGEQAEILLIDTIGELPSYYAVSDIAFVGGSLVQFGGHNLLEPAAVGIPVLTGPHCFHFMEICDLLVQGGGAIIVSSAVQLSERVCQFLSDERLRYRVGKMARQVVENNGGAVDRVMALLGKHLEQGSRLTQ